jgi:hypothetical protein
VICAAPGAWKAGQRGRERDLHLGVVFHALAFDQQRACGGLRALGQQARGIEPARGFAARHQHPGAQLLDLLLQRRLALDGQGLVDERQHGLVGTVLQAGDGMRALSGVGGKQLQGRARRLEGAAQPVVVDHVFGALG